MPHVMPIKNDAGRVVDQVWFCSDQHHQTWCFETGSRYDGCYGGYEVAHEWPEFCAVCYEPLNDGAKAIAYADAWTLPTGPNVPVLVPDADLLRLAHEWHGGYSTMLCAISQVGELRFGSEPPLAAIVESGVSYREWAVDLLRVLRGEVARLATDLRDNPTHDRTGNDRRVAEQWRDRLNAILDRLDWD